MSDTPSTRKRGRPPKPEGRTTGHQIALPPDLRDRLTAIAQREQIYHGPWPSLTGAIRWLVAKDQAQ
jgi:hypothetical protein